MKKITISYVIPVYNEEKRILKTIKALAEGFDYNQLKLEEVIFVDDGSTDKTLEVLNKYIPKLEKELNAKVNVITYKENKGKGFAIKTGMLASKSEYTLFFDADMATPITELSKFIPFMEKKTDVIVGTRKNGHSTVIEHQPLIREVLGKGFTYLTNVSLNTWVTDFTCGFKAFSYESKNKVFSASKIERWGYDAEILFLARIYGYKIQEKPVVWSDDKDSRVQVLKSVFTTLKELSLIRYYQLSSKYKLEQKKIAFPKINIRYSKVINS